jgi:Asp-tRNA(Asn)/Glu-tRNA(Gln) amidotransferase A subunit family amidase
MRRPSTADDYLRGAAPRFEFVKVLDQLLGPDAIVVSPTMCVEGFYADGRSPGEDEAGNTQAAAYNTQAANITGHPALSCPPDARPTACPSGSNSPVRGSPTTLLLAVGAAWEAAHPWPLSAPGFETVADSRGSTRRLRREGDQRRWLARARGLGFGRPPTLEQPTGTDRS